MTEVTLHAGDNRESLTRLVKQGVRVHAVVCDPPYGLVSVQKRFGKANSKPARTEKNDGSFARLSGGFMGKTWDGSGIERDPEFWQLVYDILLPGGYVFAFAGSRTGHWQACAMELAGFIMHPMHGWCFGQGFPKAHAADKAIDKMLGVKGEVVASGAPVKRMIPGADQHKTGSWIKDNGRDYQPGQYVPATAEAAEWEGYAYGTQAQKPALEPIYLAQKPFETKTGAANLLMHGVGAVNIDGCRVPTDEVISNHSRGTESAISKGKYGDSKAQETHQTAGQALGRHPANLILDGSPEVVAMFPDSKGQRAAVGPKNGNRDSVNCYGDYGPRPDTPPRGDDGSAARFFHQFPLDREGEPSANERYNDSGSTSFTGKPGMRRRDGGSAARFFHHFEPDTDPLIYHGKAGKKDRAGSKHPTVKPIALLRYLVRHITPPGGVVLDPFAGSGTTAEAARAEGFDCILMEAEREYLDFLRRRFDLPAPINDAFADLLGGGDTEDEFAELLG